MKSIKKVMPVLVLLSISPLSHSAVNPDEVFGSDIRSRLRNVCLDQIRLHPSCATCQENVKVVLGREDAFWESKKEQVRKSNGGIGRDLSIVSREVDMLDKEITEAVTRQLEHRFRYHGDLEANNKLADMGARRLIATTEPIPESGAASSRSATIVGTTTGATTGARVGAMAGATAGAVLGPVGAAIGGAIGGFGGWLFG